MARRTSVSIGALVAGVAAAGALAWLLAARRGRPADRAAVEEPSFIELPQPGPAAPSPSPSPAADGAPAAAAAAPAQA